MAVHLTRSPGGLLESLYEPDDHISRSSSCKLLHISPPTKLCYAQAILRQPYLRAPLNAPFPLYPFQPFKPNHHVPAHPSSPIRLPPFSLAHVPLISPSEYNQRYPTTINRDVRLRRAGLLLFESCGYGTFFFIFQFSYQSFAKYRTC